MGLTAKLGAFNGTVFGTVAGLALYALLANPGGIEFLIEAHGVVLFAVAGAASGNVLAFVKIFPTGPLFAGALSGLVGGVLAYALPTYVSVQLSIPTGAIGGFIAAVVVAIMWRFLPGL